MRAGVIDPTVRTPQIRLADLPEPRLAPGHVKLAVRAVAVDGFWNRTAGSPFVPGSIVAGDVVETSDGADRYSLGQPVLGLCRGGGLAERVVIPEAGLSLLDRKVSYGLATLTGAGVAASFVVSDLLETISGNTAPVAVDDASTSFGCIAGGMLRDAGIDAIGVVDSEAAAVAAAAAGYVATVVRRSDEPIAVSLLRATTGSGVAAYVDQRAATTLEDAWRMLGPGGVFVRCDLFRSRLDGPSTTAARRLAELGAKWQQFDSTALLSRRAREIPVHRSQVLDALASGRYVVPIREIPFGSIETLPIPVPSVDGHVVVTL